MIQPEEFQPGQPAWVKLNRCPWWPSLVVSKETCPVVLRPNAAVLAYIRFIPEDEYDIIYAKAKGKILPWNEENNVCLMAKAMSYLKKKDTLKEKFENALKSIEEQCGIVIPKLTKKQLKKKPIYYQPSNANNKPSSGKEQVTPKAGCSREDSKDHNHRQQQVNIDERNTTEEHTLLKKRSPEDDHVEAESAKKRKVTPKKALEFDRVEMDQENRCAWDENLERDACESDMESLPASQPSKPAESDSSDEELPDILNSSKKPPDAIKEGCFLWVKIGRWPFWPAIVKNCYRRKKILQKVSLVFIGDTPSEEGATSSRACLRYNKKTMLPFAADEEKHNQLKVEGLKCPNHGALFKDAISKVEDFLVKKCLGAATSSFHFFSEEISKATGGPDPLMDWSDEEDEEGEGQASITAVPSESESENEDDMDIIDTDLVSPEKVSEKLQKMRERRFRRAERIIEVIKTPKFKKFMFDIYNRQRPCDRHTQFWSASCQGERSVMRQHGFGPIDDEDQQMTLAAVLTDYMKELCPNKLPNSAYIFDVWVPESIIYATQKVSRRTRQVAEEMFNRGPIRTKEEMIMQHQELKECSKNIDPEDLAKYKAKIDRMQSELLKKFAAENSSHVS